MLRESRIVASLLLDEVDRVTWLQRLEKDNILQKQSAASAVRQATLIRGRLNLMKPSLWIMVKDASQDTATHALFAAAIKHSPLLGDFLDIAVRDQYRLLNDRLTVKFWNDFVAGCAARDSEMPTWSDLTITKLRQSAFKMLAQAGYIDTTKSMMLQKVHIVPEVMAYLKEHNEQYVLRCIEVSI